MSQVTQILMAIQSGQPEAADQLIPLVYDELRRLAAQKLARESPDHTLQPTALVHEAYLRLLGPDQQLAFDNRGHFFAAAAEAMRRILVENARRKLALKRGGNHDREPLDSDPVASSPETPLDDLLALDDALNRLVADDPKKAELVKLRYFAGLTQAQAADALQISVTTADRWWAYAKGFLYLEMNPGD